MAWNRFGWRAAPRRPRPGKMQTMRRFGSDRRGATAVEFAMIAAPFLALLLGIIQTGLVFFAGQVLETRVADAARLILTGQAQTQGFDATEFKRAICDPDRDFLFDCGKLMLDVRSYKAFDEVDSSIPIQDGKITLDKERYDDGGPGDIVVVKALYEWPLVEAKFGVKLSNLDSGNRLLMATAAFRNEPYE